MITFAGFVEDGPPLRCAPAGCLGRGAPPEATPSAQRLSMNTNVGKKRAATPLLPVAQNLHELLIHSGRAGLAFMDDGTYQ